MYQIYVDRFYNGDPSNDVETGEYSYIGDISVGKWDDWGKIPAVMGVREFMAVIFRELWINWIISRNLGWM